MFLAAATTIGCSDSAGRNDPLALPGPVLGISSQDSVRRGLVHSPTSAVGTSVSTSSDAVALVSLTPGNFQGYQQPQTIVGTVSGPVQGITVTGSGAIKCTGTYGAIIGYDAFGFELGRASLTLIDPADCSTPDNPDDVTFGAEGTLTVTNGIIARFEITPMSPLSFPVFSVTGHASATYAIGLSTGPGVVTALRVSCTPASVVRAQQAVTCNATLTDGGQFTVRHVKSTSSEGRVIIDADVSQPAGASAAWGGLAIVSTQVEITATVNGRDTTATGSFTVESRIGRLAGWMNEGFWDAGWSATPPTPSYVKGSPLSAQYPGFITPPSGGYAVPEGGLGLNVFAYPGSGGLARPNAGPNTGVTFVTSVPWAADQRHSPAAVGIYLAKSTQVGDPFYKKQKGPSPYCTQADMATLHGVVLAHENRHWTNFHAQLAALKVQRQFETLITLPSDPADAAIQALQQREQAYANAVTASVSQTHGVADGYPVCDMR